MKGRYLTPALWTLFAIIVLAMGYAALVACDLGFPSLFGRAYCVAPVAHTTRPDEDARRNSLEARIRDVELKIAQLPSCRASVPVPTPVPVPMPVPKTLTELKGCWESLAGDMPVVSDDAEHRPIGNMRQCFCFDAAGEGRIKQLYSDGAKCGGPVSAEIANEILKIHQPSFICRTKNFTYVPTEIACRADGDGAAICDAEGLGQVHTRSTGQRYKRVANDRCG